ncbi:lymphatic vessel endothelial hyaluronic receptor 1b precursor, partial [Silurus meridionalis]
GISEVFIVQLINQSYSFNATTAIDVCTSLGVRIASRAEVETAYRNGLQTCSKRPQRLSPWERICHKDMFETEMWKHDEQHFTMQNDHRNLGDDTPFQMDDDTISF